MSATTATTAPTYDELATLVGSLSTQVTFLSRIVENLGERLCDLEDVTYGESEDTIADRFAADLDAADDIVSRLL